MKFQVVINKPIHTIEADSIEDAERVLEEQWNMFRFELCFPNFDLDDLHLQDERWRRPPLPTLPKLQVQEAP